MTTFRNGASSALHPKYVRRRPLSPAARHMERAFGVRAEWADRIAELAGFRIGRSHHE